MYDKIMIVDLDGTLANCSWRVPMLPDYDAFHAASVQDQPYPDIVDLVNGAPDDVFVAIITGRTDTHRGITEGWLMQHGILWDALRMRSQLDYRPDTVVKSELADKLIEEVKLPVWLVLDDRDKVVEMWREKGFTCLQTRLGEY